ncbi:MAG: Hsp70 family protein [Gammaproteobacteria bacterium]|nr:Hsp70 family protein [Gammaproteobacteria bacterium]
MSVVGFDFGTTNSLISVIRGNRPINFLDEQRPIPSVVCYEGMQTIVGREAKERLARAGLGVQGNTVRSPKTLLGRESVFIEGVERHPVDIVADVVRHVVHQTKSGPQGRDLDKISGAVVTIPVDMHGHRRRALRDAFRLAGVSIVQFVHEPLAALYGYFRKDLETLLRRYDRKLILVFDWGGGTLDLTICRPMGDMVVQIMNDGTDEVGGDVFDENLMNRLVQNVCAARGIHASVDTQPGARSRLLDRCERAKIDLSMRERSQIYVGSYFRGIAEEDFDYSLSRDEFEEVVRPLLDKGLRRISQILENAGYAPEQVALCVATGGMSNMPAVKRRLHELFGPERVQISDSAATLIAEGAAWIAADQALLRLAKNVELALARNSYLPLVKAGTVMPKEGEVQRATFHLYCTDPRDGVAKFQICSPKRAGRSVLPGEPRAHLETVTVEVDANTRPFRERLELDVSINDDLILEAHARSLNLKDQDRREIHNLEFGLAFPNSSAAGGNEIDDGHSPIGEPRERGGLSLRANVADLNDQSLVPGELLYQYDPHYFDVRREPPEHQVQEMLYYEPCSICRRASNDPLCRCTSLLTEVAPTPAEQPRAHG